MKTRFISMNNNAGAFVDVLPTLMARSIGKSKIHSRRENRWTESSPHGFGHTCTMEIGGLAQLLLVKRHVLAKWRAVRGFEGKQTLRKQPC